MPRPAPTHRLVALAIVIALLAGCTGSDASTAPTPSTTGSPTTSATPQATATTSQSPSSAGSSRPTPSPTETVPPVSKELLAEAKAVYGAGFAAIRKARAEGGFSFDDIPPDYPKHLMGGTLMNAVMQAANLHDEGQREYGKVELVNVRPYPAMDAGSLVALTGCSSKTEVRVADEKGYGRDESSEQQVVYLKRDDDGLLKIAQLDTIQVTACTPTSADPKVVAEATKVYTTVFTLFEKYLLGDGLSPTAYSTSGFGPYLGGEARNAIMWELESRRANQIHYDVGAPAKQGKITEWPRRLRGSVVALTSCYDRSHIHLGNNLYRQPPRIYFAHFTRDKAGKLRMTSLDWIYADACA
ncbi:hypothetical protein [Aestuariimicrobium sp. Y1814]|uniref:hypothetical protein n=1 Tax=Aestuariimicrobium sp. Y1814 TaxID=3418742 RepID=UPI003DA7092D